MNESLDKTEIICKAYEAQVHEFFGCAFLGHIPSFFYNCRNSKFPMGYDLETGVREIRRGVGAPFATASTAIDEKNILIKIEQHYENEVDVGLLEVNPHFCINEGNWVSEEVIKWKKENPKTPLILYGNEYSRSIDPAKGKKSMPIINRFEELQENREEQFIQQHLSGFSLTQTRVNQLVQKLGAVKYVGVSSKSGRGIKILLDEIAYAGLGKLKDKEKREKTERKHCNIM